MQQLLQAARSNGIPVEERFAVPHERGKQPVAYRLDNDRLNPELARIGRRYLIHWTRASNGPWPDERAIDFYAAVIESHTYPRSVFCTLMNILLNSRITATGTNMPDRTATVSLSGLPPTDTIPLMRWRARYRHMSFEPYGIGIARSLTEMLGLRQVRYADRRSTAITEDDVWLTQSPGKRSDWRAEDEYRHRGDILLSDVPHDKLLAFCLTSEEAALITKVTGIRAVPFQQ